MNHLINAQNSSTKIKIKTLFSSSKLILLLIIIFIFMISGIYLMDQKGNRKVQGIWIKAPFREKSTLNEPTSSPIPTPDPTLHWKIYANKSFSIKYPERFSVKNAELPYSVLYSKIYSSTIFTDGESTITITVAENSSNFSLSTIPGNGPHLRYISSNISNDARQKTLIDGVDTIVTNRIPTGIGGAEKEILFIANGKVYQITLSPFDTDHATLDEMLKTFKVIDQEPAGITDNWHIYIDSHYGYTLKYPTNYDINHEKNASISALTIISDADKTDPNAQQFKIEVQDIKNIGLSNTTSRNLLGLTLTQYANKKWEYAKATSSAVPTKTVSTLKELTVSGKPAYQLFVTEEYRDDKDTEMLSEEYVFIFTESGGYKYKVWYPKNDNTFYEVFKTLTFTK